MIDAHRLLVKSANGLAVMAGVELVAAASGRSVVDAVGKVIIDRGPLPVVETTVKLLRTADKPVIRGATLALTAAGIGLAIPGVSAMPTGAMAAVASLGLGGAQGLLALRRHRHREGTARPRRAPGNLLPASDGAETWGHPTPLLTSPRDFYVTDVNMRPPLVDPKTWSLDICGPEVATTVTWDQLWKLDLTDFHATLVCVHNRLGWDRLGTQEWTGLPLHRLLSAVGVQVPTDTAQIDVLLTAVDGWTQLIPGEVAVSRSWAVCGMAGRPLTAAHGFPLRLITPGIVGQYGAIKWLRKIEVVPVGTRDAYWQARGWPRQPVAVLPSSRIDLPRSRARVDVGPNCILGVAWAPPEEVGEVLVRVDDGCWQRAELAAQLSPWTWRRWRHTVDLSPGPHRLQAKTIGADGREQVGVVQPPFPEGQTGWHSVNVTAL